MTIQDCDLGQWLALVFSTTAKITRSIVVSSVDSLTGVSVFAPLLPHTVLLVGRFLYF